jgi:hypothetical protein
MEKRRTVDTVNGNSHTVDTVVSAMKNACKNVSYSNNSHITRLELNSESEEHTGHGLTSSQYTGHDLTLGDEQDEISYIKILNYTQEMMEKFLDDLGSSVMKSSNMKSSTKTSNSVDLGQCNKISRGLGGLNQDQVTISRELNQDQVIQITNEVEFHLKIQSPANQRGATDGFCGRAKYRHFRPDKDGHFGPDKDFYMSDKWNFRA